MYINNIGTASFTFLATQLAPNGSRTVMWNGSIWVLSGNADDRSTGQVRKSADELVTNSTVIQNDDHLSFAVGANETWMFQIIGAEKNAATPGIKMQMTVPAGTSNCSNTITTSYNGAAWSGTGCSTPVAVTGFNNYAAAGNTDAFVYM